MVWGGRGLFGAVGGSLGSWMRWGVSGWMIDWLVGLMVGVGEGLVDE